MERTKFIFYLWKVKKGSSSSSIRFQSSSLNFHITFFLAKCWKPVWQPNKRLNSTFKKKTFLLFQVTFQAIIFFGILISMHFLSPIFTQNWKSLFIFTANVCGCESWSSRSTKWRWWCRKWSSKWISFKSGPTLSRWLNS